MGGGAGAGRLEAAAAGVRDVALVVGAVDILAIPASNYREYVSVGAPVRTWRGNSRGEGDGCPDTAGAHLAGERSRVFARAGRAAERGLLDVVLAAVADLLLHAFLSAEARLADQHAEALAGQYPLIVKYEVAWCSRV